MGELLPNWGKSALPSTIYYYMKLLRHIFGIIDSSHDRNTVYVGGETVVGDITSRHVLSYVYDNITRRVSVDDKYLRLYLNSVRYF